MKQIEVGCINWLDGVEKSSSFLKQYRDIPGVGVE
jgi:hypothetical protein